MLEVGVALAVILALLAAAVSVFTLLVHIRYPDLTALASAVHKATLTGNAALEDIEALRDSLEHHQRRLAQRARRDGAEARALAQADAQGAPQGDLARTSIPKAELYRIAAGKPPQRNPGG